MYLALAVAVAAVGTAVWHLACEVYVPGRRLWLAYAQWIETALRSLFVRRTATFYARCHFGGALFVAIVGALLGDWRIGLACCGIAAAAGFAWPSYARRERIAKLETQIEPALRSIAQTLTASSNLIDALETVVHETNAPLSQELRLLVGQVRLGMTIEDALLAMGKRVDSRNLDAVIVALVLGRHTGGNLPQLLSELALSLREGMRLEAVIQSRTAEGKAQAWIMGSMPVVLGVVVYRMDPTFMRPMFVDPLGWAILGAIVLLMFLGVYFVRKVSAVDA